MEPSLTTYVRKVKVSRPSMINIKTNVAHRTTTSLPSSVPPGKLNRRHGLQEVLQDLPPGHAALRLRVPGHRSADSHRRGRHRAVPAVGSAQRHLGLDQPGVGGRRGADLVPVRPQPVGQPGRHPGHGPRAPLAPALARGARQAAGPVPGRLRRRRPGLHQLPLRHPRVGPRVHHPRRLHHQPHGPPLGRHLRHLSLRLAQVQLGGRVPGGPGFCRSDVLRLEHRRGAQHPLRRPPGFHFHSDDCHRRCSRLADRLRHQPGTRLRPQIVLRHHVRQGGFHCRQLLLLCASVRAHLRMPCWRYRLRCRAVRRRGLYHCRCR